MVAAKELRGDQRLNADPRAGSRSAILIPAFRPDDRLLQLVDDLLAAGFNHLVVVDDGSGASFRPLFAEVGQRPEVQVLRHAVNLGKGAALKTGINHIATSLEGRVDRIITVDADGQHLVEDVVGVCRESVAKPQSLIVGGRAFAGKVPLRSRFGNFVTRQVFRMLVGVRLNDTQSGLRAIPLQAVPWLLRIRSMRYEFELDMLIEGARRSIPVAETPIKTVYLEDNRSSHFRPLIDSLRIYLVFLRYVLASVATAGVDFVVFTAVWFLLGHLAVAIAVARLVAGAFQYQVCRQAVFHSRRRITRSLPLFAGLVAANGLLSYLLLAAWAMWVTSNSVAILAMKVVVEGLLFVLGFAVQRMMIFPPRKDAPQPAPPKASPDRTSEAEAEAENAATAASPG